MVLRGTAMLKIKDVKQTATLTYVLSFFTLIFSLTPIAYAHDGNQALAAIVLDRDAEQRARDMHRHPVQTLSFFHIEKGMKVAEALPGGGWYSQILAQYLGAQGQLHGINYNDDMWAMFGFFSPERITDMQSNTAKFPEMIAGFTDNGIVTSGFTFATAPKSAHGTLDRVLFVRALHNLNRFEEQAGTRSQALQVAFDLLKPEGLVGVVQHRAPESMSEASTDGSRGYLKQSTVVKAFEDAGFELVMTSEINANDKDKAGANDIVWRLPPGFNGVGDDEEKRKAMMLIGESDRMTLLFKKRGANFDHE